MHVPAIQSPIALALAPREAALRLTRIPEEHRAALGQEGLVEGAEVAIESVVPMGGPLIVRLGGTRLALARSIARTIHVAPVQADLEAADAHERGR